MDRVCFICVGRFIVLLGGYCVLVSEQDWKTARRFKAGLSKRITVAKLILFGSRARGEGTGDSDFDWIVVSPSFKGIEWHERALKKKVFDAWNAVAPADFICYTPNEFDDCSKRVSIVKKAL